jgi:hypothetical protein
MITFVVGQVRRTIATVFSAASGSALRRLAALASRPMSVMTTSTCVASPRSRRDASVAVDADHTAAEGLEDEPEIGVGLRMVVDP